MRTRSVNIPAGCTNWTQWNIKIIQGHDGVMVICWLWEVGGRLWYVYDSDTLFACMAL